jgi:hypothetical protein
VLCRLTGQQTNRRRAGFREPCTRLYTCTTAAISRSFQPFAVRGLARHTPARAAAARNSKTRGLGLLAPQGAPATTVGRACHAQQTPTARRVCAARTRCVAANLSAATLSAARQSGSFNLLGQRRPQPQTARCQLRRAGHLSNRRQTRWGSAWRWPWLFGTASMKRAAGTRCRWMTSCLPSLIGAGGPSRNPSLVCPTRSRSGAGFRRSHRHSDRANRARSCLIPTCAWGGATARGAAVSLCRRLPEGPSPVDASSALTQASNCVR